MNKLQDQAPVAELLDLGGRCILVTGSSGNIGQSIAMRLAEAGAKLIVHYSDGKKRVRNLVAEIEAMDGSAVPIKADLRSDFSTANMFDRLKDKGLEFDGLVNNAAVQPVVELANISRQDWRHVLECNLEGAFMTATSAARAWADAGVRGDIVNIASIEGLDPAIGHAHYASSKAGLLMMTRAMALEFGPQGTRVNAVSPGLVDRNGLQEEWPEGVAKWERNAPLGRLGLPGDVADAVLFLLSPAARWISGANLVVDGGMSVVPRW